MEIRINRILACMDDEFIISEIFQNVVLYFNSIEKNNSKILDKHLVDKIKRDLKETIAFMNESYNGNYRRVKEINDEITKKLNSNKR